MLVRPKNKSYFGAFPDLLPYQLPHFQLAHPAKQSLLLDGLVETTPCEGVITPRQDQAWVGVRDGKGFVNSAGTAGRIRTRDGSFDEPERQNDDGGGRVALHATWHVPRAAAWTLRKMLCQGCSPNGKWPRAQTFRSEAPWSELCAIQRISLEGSKLCPQSAILFFSALCPLARTPLDLETPNLVYGCMWARAIRICTI